MKYKVKIAILAVIISVFAMVAQMSPVQAATPSDRSLGISPLRSELTILPGTSFDGRLTLTNSGKESLLINLNTEIFNVTNTQYDYSFTDSGTGSDWVTFSEDTVTILPGKSSTVDYKVAVPIQTEPGGRYISMFASSSPSTSAGGVTSINRVASLLYITVDGDVTRTGKVLTFNSPIVSIDNPTWTTTVQNSGSTHFRSPYNVTVKTLFGGQTIATNQNDALILPSSVRLLSQSIPEPDWLGIYRLDYTVGLGDVPAQQETRWMLYLPPVQSVLVLGILLGLFVLRPRRIVRTR